MACVTDVVKFASTAEHGALLPSSVKTKESKMTHRLATNLVAHAAIHLLKISVVLWKKITSWEDRYVLVQNITNREMYTCESCVD